jgi:hypothetical protein
MLLVFGNVPFFEELLRHFPTEKGELEEKKKNQDLHMNPARASFKGVHEANAL